MVSIGLPIFWMASNSGRIRRSPRRSRMISAGEILLSMSGAGHEKMDRADGRLISFWFKWVRFSLSPLWQWCRAPVSGSTKSEECKFCALCWWLQNSLGQEKRRLDLGSGSARTFRIQVLLPRGWESLYPRLQATGAGWFWRTKLYL